MKIARISNEPRIDASTGFCIGQAASAGIGFGLPKSSRQAAVVALTGFHSAIVCSTGGIVEVGTKAFETKEIGKKIMKPMALAVSVVRAKSPRVAPTQIIESPKR